MLLSSFILQSLFSSSKVIVRGDDANRISSGNNSLEAHAFLDAPDINE